MLVWGSHLETPASLGCSSRVWGPQGLQHRFSSVTPLDYPEQLGEFHNTEPPRNGEYSTGSRAHSRV